MLLNAIRNNDASASDRDKLRQKHIDLRKPVIAKYQAAIDRHLDYAMHETLRNIEEFHLHARVMNADRGGAAADVMFDYDRFRDGLTASLRGVSSDTLQRAGGELYDELEEQGIDRANGDDPFSMPSKEAKAFLDQRENRIKDASQGIFDEVKGELQAGIDAGDSTSALADRIRSKFADISKGRATTIASTETGAAYGTARDIGMKEAGIPFKEWLTSGLPNVREAHEMAEGQVVAVDAPFRVGGEDLDFPGDPEGDTDNVINCHCIALARKKAA